MIKKMKIRSKMLLSFMCVMCFTLSIGYQGIHSIGEILHQNELNFLVNEIASSSQDAQASALRYIIYKDDAYIQESTEASNRGISSAGKLPRDLESENDSQLIEKLIDRMTAYEELNQQSYRIQQQEDESDSVRSESAQKVLSNIKEAIAYTEKSLDSATLSAADYNRTVADLRDLQNILEITYDYHSNGFSYKLALTDGERAKQVELWTAGVEQSRLLLTELLNRESDEYLLSLTAQTIGYIDEYYATIEDYVNMVQRQTDIYASQHEASQEVMSLGDQVSLTIEKEIDRNSRHDIILTIIFSAVAMLLSIVITLRLTSSLARQLGGEPHEIEEITSRIAKGDLTLTFPDRKLTGIYASMKEMTDQLKTIIDTIITSADEVTKGSEEIASSASEISSGSTEQAANMEEIAASMEELNANIQQNTENASRSNTMAKDVASEIEDSSRSVKETVEAMKMIDQKISIVEELARNTNLLALNAAIEAARAGEAGKGFAVVASEVRKLAVSSGTAAKEITEITRESVRKADQAQVKIENVVPDIITTAGLVEEIAYASEEQNRGSAQVNEAVTQLDMVIQQNASASEELASMSEELSSHAQMMVDVVNFFKVQESDRSGKDQNAVVALPRKEKKSNHSRLLLASLTGSINRLPSEKDGTDKDFIEF